jgi:hypothetical protein
LKYEIRLYNRRGQTEARGPHAAGQKFFAGTYFV